VKEKTLIVSTGTIILFLYCYALVAQEGKDKYKPYSYKTEKWVGDCY